MYVNIDINSRTVPFYISLLEKEVVTEEDVASHLDMYTSHNITDLLFDIFCQYSATDSEIWDSYKTKYEQKTENGFPVDYTGGGHGALYSLNKKHGIDPYRVWFKTCRERGMRPWISIRMNDSHVPDADTCFLRSDFFYEAKEKGWMLGEEYGYAATHFDYAVPKVRKMMLDYIEEQMLRYDVDGLELDFMREIYCFDYLHADMDECRDIMNEFVRSVRKILDEAEKKHGHKISLCVRLTRDIDQSRFVGLDARAWAKEGLVDVIVPSPRWASSDSRMPMDVWKRELPGVKILPCIDTVVINKYQGNAFATVEIARGNAGAYLADGAEDIYLFNYFGDPHNDKEYFEKRDVDIYDTCYSLDVIESLPVRYTIMEQEDRMIPQGFKGDQPLPINLSEKKEKLEIKTAHIGKGRDVSVVLGFTEGTPDLCEILLNGEKCSGFTEIEIPEPKKAVPLGTRCFRCNVTKVDGLKQVFEFSGKESGIVWVEIEVK